MKPIEVYIRKKFPDQLSGTDYTILVRNLGQYLC